MPYISNTSVMIGIEEGYFGEQGIEVQPVLLKGTSDVLALLATGEIDAGTPALNPGLYNAVAAGAPMRIVLPLTVHRMQDCTTIALMARQDDIDSGRLADPADWAGLKVMVTDAGPSGTGAYYLTHVLEPTGLRLSDVQLLKGESAIHAEALRSGQVDMTLGIEPWIAQATLGGGVGVLLPLEGYGHDLQASVIVFGGRLLEDRDLGVRLATAYLKSARQFALGPTARNVEIAAAFTGLDADLVARLCWSVTPTDGAINTESILIHQDWLLSEGLIDRELAPEEFIDTGFAEEAVGILNE